MPSAQAPDVVVVDDEPAVVQAVCDLFTLEGIRAIGCEHAPDAFALICQERPRLVVLDVHMPGVDGVQIFRLMRANPETLHIPVIFLTGNAYILAQRLSGYRQMHARLLTKPFALDALLSLVEEMLVP